MLCCECLLEKHKKYLDMVRWATLPEITVVFVQAPSCSKIRGIINKDSTEQHSQHNIYVDENLMADIARRLPYTLVAAIEAIFVIMGVPNLLLRPYAVAMDKWKKLYVHAIQVLLGLLWNTRDMTVGITPDYRVETIHLLCSTWNHGRKRFTISELEKW